MLRILYLSILLFSFSARAEDKPFDCSAEKERITKDLMKDVECVHDDECGYFNFGYPWQPDACIKAIINISKEKENHNITNLRVIEQYNQQCIYQKPDEKKKYEDFNEKLALAKCKEPPRVYCYKGFCRIQSYAIYNDK